MKNAHLDEDGIMQIDWDTCNNCGKCVDACNFDCVTEAKAGYKIKFALLPDVSIGTWDDFKGKFGY